MTAVDRISPNAVPHYELQSNCEYLQLDLLDPSFIDRLISHLDKVPIYAICIIALSVPVSHSLSLVSMMRNSSICMQLKSKRCHLH